MNLSWDLLPVLTISYTLTAGSQHRGKEPFFPQSVGPHNELQKVTHQLPLSRSFSSVLLTSFTGGNQTVLLTWNISSLQSSLVDQQTVGVQLWSWDRDTGQNPDQSRSTRPQTGLKVHNKIITLTCLRDSSVKVQPEP